MNRLAKLESEILARKRKNKNVAKRRDKKYSAQFSDVDSDLTDLNSNQFNVEEFFSDKLIDQSFKKDSSFLHGGNTQKPKLNLESKDEVKKEVKKVGLVELGEIEFTHSYTEVIVKAAYFFPSSRDPLVNRKLPVDKSDTFLLNKDVDPIRKVYLKGDWTQTSHGRKWLLTFSDDSGKLSNSSQKTRPLGWAYYLPWKEDCATIMKLGSEAEWFFTGKLKGCGLMIYETKRGETVVVHINSKIVFPSTHQSLIGYSMTSDLVRKANKIKTEAHTNNIDTALNSQFNAVVKSRIPALRDYGMDKDDDDNTGQSKMQIILPSQYLKDSNEEILGDAFIFGRRRKDENSAVGRWHFYLVAAKQMHFPALTQQIWPI